MPYLYLSTKFFFACIKWNSISCKGSTKLIMIVLFMTLHIWKKNPAHVVQMCYIPENFFLETYTNLQKKILPNSIRDLITIWSKIATCKAGPEIEGKLHICECGALTNLQSASQISDYNSFIIISFLSFIFQWKPFCS